MKDKEGRAITPLVENAYRPLVITAEAEDFFFGGQVRHRPADLGE